MNEQVIQLSSGYYYTQEIYGQAMGESFLWMLGSKEGCSEDSEF